MEHTARNFSKIGKKEYGNKGLPGSALTGRIHSLFFSRACAALFFMYAGHSGY